MFVAIKNFLIVIFCIFHITAIAWWTLPHSYADLVSENPDQTYLEYKLFEWLRIPNNSQLSHLFSHYINVTGSQQYWDFFAPQSPKFHQYVSVCTGLDINKASGAINCAGTTLFSNLKHNDTNYKVFSDSSRYYRLTETLINQNDPKLFKAFSHYYLTHQADNFSNTSATEIILHQFELYPDLKDLPNTGYRTDTILWESH